MPASSFIQLPAGMQQDEPFSTPYWLPAVSQSPEEAPAVCGALPRAALGLGDFCSGPRSHLPGFSLESSPVVTQASRPGLQGPSVGLPLRENSLMTISC